MLQSVAEVLEGKSVVRDPAMIHPLIYDRVQQLVKRLGLIEWSGPRLEIFETWRSPARQAYLGTKRPRVTEVTPWMSAHQYGLAVDFAGRTKGGDWTWEVPARTWRILRHQADSVGLAVPAPSWDPGHVEFEHWPDVRDLFIA